MSLYFLFTLLCSPLPVFIFTFLQGHWNPVFRWRMEREGVGHRRHLYLPLFLDKKCHISPCPCPILKNQAHGQTQTQKELRKIILVWRIGALGVEMPYGQERHYGFLWLTCCICYSLSVSPSLSLSLSLSEMTGLGRSRSHLLRNSPESVLGQFSQLTPPIHCLVKHGPGVLVAVQDKTSGMALFLIPI